MQKQRDKAFVLDRSHAFEALVSFLPLALACALAWGCLLALPARGENLALAR